MNLVNYIMRKEIKYFPQQTYISLDCWNIVVSNNVSATGCYIVSALYYILAKLIATPTSFS